MRLTPRKVLTYFFIFCAVFFISFNFYYRKHWIFEFNSFPWKTKTRDRNSANALFPYEKISRVSIEEIVNKQVVRDHSVAPKSITSVKKPVYWPDVAEYDDDRILAQLEFRPKLKKDKMARNVITDMKTILLYHGLGSMDVPPGQEIFKQHTCPVDTCTITDNHLIGSSADAVLFKERLERTWTKRPPGQIWIIFLLESPLHTPGLSAFENLVNWTASYRRDSDIVAPYEKFVPYNEAVQTLHQNRSYAAGKTKKVAWFVSNCVTLNGRLNYAQELANYISVDIYGNCGPLKCPRHNNDCFEMLNTDYKFYLSFENSNCRDYITEKFFVSGLMHDAIPIVMGAAPEDYSRAAPPHSYIHVDDFASPKDLADYLHKLDQNDHLYNEYFAWKGTGRLINTFFWCRVCAMLHEPDRHPSSYRDIEKWWRGDEICINDYWRNHPRHSKHSAWVLQCY
ncbi:hypothetical protein CHS0354_031824 [Potamilus streckersoni]|uniref:Fucosyltransferase n=1 Tax=Potamilus streckersoni TaxID=2493646 RepID=A0AAE0VLV3_9BIVA|nr:hypothetical protein CHS0354_031824 [Potamilus streckersoni]